MGLFDNLLAPFSSQPQQNAAKAQQQSLLQGYNTAQPLLQQGAGALQTGYGQAQGNVVQGYGAGLGDINQQYQAGLQPLQQNYAGATAGANQLANLLGFGPQGGAGVQSALANTPGYQFTLSQGTQNVDRNQAAQGALQSGNTDKAVADYTTGLANQTYQNAVNNLQPYLGYQQNAGNSLAGMYGQYGNAQNANLTGMAGAQAGLNTGLAQGLAGNLGQQAGLGYGTDVGIGNAQANAALAPQTAGQNAWNLAGNLGKLAVSPISGGGNSGQPTKTLAGSLFSNIFG